MAQQEPPVTESAQPRQPQPAGRSRDRLGSALIRTGVILLVLVAAGWGWLWWSQRDDRAARAEAVAVAEAERQVIEHIHRWAQATVEARRTLDLRTLDGIYEPGSAVSKTEIDAIENLRRQGLRAEVTRHIRSVEVTESSRDRAVVRAVWEEPVILFKDARSGELRYEADGFRWTSELYLRLVDDRWLVTRVVFLKQEPVTGATETSGQPTTDETGADETGASP